MSVKFEAEMLVLRRPPGEEGRFKQQSFKRTAHRKLSRALFRYGYREDNLCEGLFWFRGPGRALVNYKSSKRSKNAQEVVGFVKSVLGSTSKKCDCKHKK